jgi:hypothetical protein
MPSLIPSELRAILIANGEKTKAGIEHDPRPVVKLFTPDAGATWLLSELDPDDPDIAFGLCDLGLGYPEVGTVSITELERVRGQLGLPVECDKAFAADKSLSAYADAAIDAGAIRA